MGAPQDRFSVQLEENGLVSVRWEPRIVLRDADGEQLTAQLRSALPGLRVHLLMFLNGMESLSQDSLAYFARRAPLSAVALVAPSVLDQALIELYLEVYRPPYPVGYFQDGASARAWLGLQPTLGPTAPRG